VRLKTGRLRYGRAYWLSILRFERLLDFAEAEATWESEESLRISTSNVSQLCVTVRDGPATINIQIDAQTPLATSVPASRQVILEREAGKWRPSRTRTTPRKRAGLEGPIEDAMMSRFIVVIGTAGEGLDREIAEAEARAFLRQWETRFGYSCLVKQDRELTEEDIENSNLILYGAPSLNEMTARIAEALPITVNEDAVTVGDRRFGGEDVGVKFCYPNPLNPDRYVVVVAATSWRGMFQINNRFGNWFNWSAYENRGYFDYGVFDSRTKSPETFLLVGYFDQDWKLDEQYMFSGSEEHRTAAETRRVPRFHEIPKDQDELYLSDLRPAAIEQERGAVNFDLSLEGNRLCLGGRTFEKGLGVKARSVVSFALHGQFKRLSAFVGVDKEGVETVSRQRQKHDRVIFRVRGDGKLLLETPALGRYDECREIVVSVARVHELTLEAHVGSRYRWFVGSAGWGDAKVTR